MNLAQALIRRALSVYRRRPKVPGLSIAELCTRYALPRGGILHLGANDGIEAESYHRCGFERVLWVEGFPTFYQALVERIAAYPGQSAHNVLISDVDGEELEFRIAENGVSSTVFASSETYQEDFPQVNFLATNRLHAQRLDTFIASNSVELSHVRVLVVDLEGSELKALLSLGRYLDQIDFALIEVSLTENFVRGPMLSEIDAFMLSKGFVRTEARMGSSSGDAFYVRRVASSLERLSMRASCYFHSQAFYRLYRHNFVKGVKRFVGETPPVRH
jgi:FkbM family methyltransferase